VLPLFEEQHPNDSTPRAALDEVKLWLAGKSSKEKVEAAADAAWDAANDASTAYYVARAAANAAYYAANAAWGANATGAAAHATWAVKDKGAERQWQLELLKELSLDFIEKWKKKRRVA